MKLIINDNITIKELQQQFSLGFLYLKLEFFDIPPTKNGLPKSHMYPAYKLLGACRKMHHEGIVQITPGDTVQKLEGIFWTEYGLSAEVFRKSGNLWIETTLSDSWTLKKQNAEGQIFSSAKGDKYIEPDEPWADD